MALGKFGVRVASTTLDPTTTAEVRRLVDAQDKIGAIKAVRKATGLGLAEAKAMVEAVESGKSMSTTSIELTGEDGAQIKALLHSGKEIEAIRLLRDASNGLLGLKSARVMLHAYRRHLARSGADAAAAGTQAAGSPAADPSDVSASDDGRITFTMPADIAPTVKRSAESPLAGLIRLLIVLAIAGGIFVWVFGWPVRL